MFFNSTVLKGDRESLQQTTHEVVLLSLFAHPKGFADMPFLLAL
jgi:hypothetical protein